MFSPKYLEYKKNVSHDLYRPLVRYLSIIPSFVIIALFITIFISYFDNILLPDYQKINFSWNISSLLFILKHIPFNFCFFLSFYSYIKCIFTNPGRVDEEVNHELSKRLPSSSVVRHCFYCNIDKFPRIHHCSVCNMCVTNMDHHCVWLCNCIGHYNKKFFNLFLFYATLGSLFFFLFASQIVYHHFQKRVYGVLPPMLMIGLCLSISFCLTLIFFGGFHIYLILNNITTLEVNTYLFSRERGINPYDLGWKKNWCFIMGKNPWLWLLPVANTPPFSWELRHDFVPYESDIEQQDSSFYEEEEEAEEEENSNNHRQHNIEYNIPFQSNILKYSNEECARLLPPV
ncbi:hypothetical protein WA158_004748 [Blastocystis sp. Blastoise]